MTQPSVAGPMDRSEVLTLGETMALFRAQATGPLPQVSSWALGIGGAESNVAVALRRLGRSVVWVGRVGADSLGDLVLRELTAEGVTTVAVRDEDAPTGLMIKERRTQQTQRVWYHRKGSAGSRLCPGDLPLERIAAARLLHVTGITPALSATAAAAVSTAVSCAKAAGVPVSLDLNYRAALWSPSDAARWFRSTIPEVDVVFAGHDEAELALGAAGSPLELAHMLAALGPSQAVVKLGAAGCAAVIDGDEHTAAAVQVDVLDSVGAGDAFVAGYVAELLEGCDVPTRLSTATRVGAFACMVPGDWEGMPRREELALLEQHEPVTR